MAPARGPGDGTLFRAVFMSSLDLTHAQVSPRAVAQRGASGYAGGIVQCPETRKCSMIISRSHHFVFLRVPKVASTSVAQAIYDSDLVSLQADITPGLEQEQFVEGGRSHKGRVPINAQPLSALMKSRQRFEWESWWPWPRQNRMFFMHATYAQLVAMNLIEPGLPSYATIRRPVDRFLSIWSFLLRGLRSMGAEHERVFREAPTHVREILELDPNGFCDAFLTVQPDAAMRQTPLVFIELFRKGQLYWGNEETCYWAVENLADDLARLFAEKGVEPVALPHLKRDRGKQERKVLTEGRQKVLMDFFARDFTRWESLQA